MVANMINNKKLNPVVSKLFIRGRKLIISIVFVTQSYFKVPKRYLDQNSTHFFTLKVPSKGELQQSFLNHSSDINLKYFKKIYKKNTAEKYPFLFNNATLPADNPLRFRKNILE